MPSLERGGAVNTNNVELETWVSEAVRDDGLSAWDSAIVSMSSYPHPHRTASLAVTATVVVAEVEEPSMGRERWKMDR